MLVDAFQLSVAVFQLLQRIETVDGEGHLRKRHGDLFGEGVLAVAGVEGKVHLASEVSLVGDTALEGVTQILVGGGGVVFVEVGADDVDVSREAVPRMGLGVLLVGPLYLEVGALVVVGSALVANLVDGEAQRQRTVVLVTLVVAESRLERPTATGVDIAQQLEVVMLVDGPVVTAVLKVKAAVGRLTVGGDDDA